MDCEWNRAAIHRRKRALFISHPFHLHFPSTLLTGPPATPVESEPHCRNSANNPGHNFLPGGSLAERPKLLRTRPCLDASHRDSPHGHLRPPGFVQPRPQRMERVLPNLILSRAINICCKSLFEHRVGSCGVIFGSSPKVPSPWGFWRKSRLVLSRFGRKQPRVSDRGASRPPDCSG